MSFGKLKSARKAKELHSFVKTDGSSLTDASSELGASSSTAQATVSAAHAVLHRGENVEVQVDSLRIASEPAAGEARADNAPNEALADEQQGKQSDLKADPTIPGKAPDRPHTETAAPVSSQGCYASLPASLEIRESSRHGRGMYTKAALHAGQFPDLSNTMNFSLTASATGSVILSIRPHVSVLSTPYLDQHCSSCAAPATESGLKRCPRCKTVHYCTQVRI